MTKVYELQAVATLTMGTSPKGSTYNSDGTGMPLLNGPTEFGAVHPVCTLFTTSPVRTCKAGDLLFCVRGSTTGRMNWADRPYAIGRGVAAIRSYSPPETRYLRYYLEAHLPSLLKRAGGGTFPNLRQADIATFPILWPDNRKEIAAVLTAYDELIENNTRRIQVLEDMVQALYREWFVEYRFPGHEDVELVDSELGAIPMGWHVSTFGDAFQVVGGATPSTKCPEYWDGGTINWYTPSDLTRHGHMFIDKSSRRITQAGLDACSATLFPAGSVMMTSRATLGVLAINTEPACTNQGFITVLPNERLPAAFIYFLLASKAAEIEALASGATFKEISKRSFRTIRFALPPVDLVTRFTKLTDPMLGLIRNLIRQNANLRATRDLLLPRLVSGEIDVSNLDIDTEWLVA